MRQTAPIPLSDAAANSALNGARPFIDPERAARLTTIVTDPDQHLVFGQHSRSHLMTVCIYGLIESMQWEKAFRALAALNRYERDIERERARNKHPATVGSETAPSPQMMPGAPAARREPKPARVPQKTPRPVPRTMTTAEMFKFCADQQGLTVEQFDASLADPPFT